MTLAPVEVERNIKIAVEQTKKGCEKMIELDQIKYELSDEMQNLKEMGESL